MEFKEILNVDAALGDEIGVCTDTSATFILITDSLK